MVSLVKSSKEEAARQADGRGGGRGGRPRLSVWRRNNFFLLVPNKTQICLLSPEEEEEEEEEEEGGATQNVGVAIKVSSPPNTEGGRKLGS